MSFHIPDTSSPNVLYARSLLSFRSCVSCPSTSPSCPTCDDGYTCTMTSQSCSACASTQCVKSPTSSDSSSSSNNSGGGGSDAGAIAGGVIGGVAFIAIVTFLVWWFFIRKKRQEQAASVAEKASTFNDARQSRKSTHSIASTVLTRASNVIQIAYIPGVTNRSPPETPGHLVPPVPPLPGAHPDQHFFMPGDLRDSTWSEMSNERRSIAPSLLRSSVATTIYRNNAIVSPMPAQQVMRTRAAVVNINGAADAPAVPAITQAQLAKAGVTTTTSNSSIVARTVTAKPVMVRGASKKKNNNAPASPAVQTIEEQPETNSAAASKSPSTQEKEETPTSGFDENSSDEEDSAPKTTPAQNTNTTETAKEKTQSRPATVIEDSPAVSQSPFKDQPAETDRRASARASSLLETPEGTQSNRSSRHLPPRVESPFSDANEVK